MKNPTPPFLYAVLGSPLLIALFGVEYAICVIFLCVADVNGFLALLLGLPIAYLLGRVILYLLGKSSDQSLHFRIRVSSAPKAP